VQGRLIKDLAVVLVDQTVTVVAVVVEVVLVKLDKLVQQP
jgi:hypothetical protein